MHFHLKNHEVYNEVEKYEHLKKPADKDFH